MATLESFAYACSKLAIFYPGIVFILLGLVGDIPLLFGDITIGGVTLGVHSLAYFAGLIVVGVAAVSYGYLTQLYAINSGYILDVGIPRALKLFSHEQGVLVGAFIVFAGVVLSLASFVL